MYGDWMPKRPAEWSTGLPRRGSVDALLNTGFNNTEAYRFQMNSSLKWFIPYIEGLSASVDSYTGLGGKGLISGSQSKKRNYRYVH